MSNLSIDLSNYGFQSGAGGQQFDGFGQTSAENVDLLNKALAAEQITGRETTNLTDASGAPLKVESLEKTLKHITYREEDIVIWRDVPKKQAFNTVEEYNQQASYGQDRGGFNAEGELPDEEDSIFVRRAQLVKYLGVTKSVTHPMTLVNTHIGPIIQKTVNDGTMWILRKVNEALYYGNAELNPLEFNGFLAQQQQSDAWSDFASYMDSEHVIDMRGKQLSENAIQNGCNTIVENYGRATRLYGSPNVLSNFVQNFYGNKYIVPNTPSLENGTMGQVVNTFASQFGKIDLRHDVFFRKKPFKNSTSSATSQKAPNAPVWGGTPTNVVTGVQGSHWQSADAGNVFYAVSAINRYGESALTIASDATAAVANGAVDLTFTDGGGVYRATSYRIYRTFVGQDGTANFYPLFDVSRAQLLAGYDGAAGGAVRDMNRRLPDTDEAMLVQFNTEVVEFAQLAPLMKMDLALLGPAYRFMVLLYGTPFLYAPKKMVRIINIGNYAA